MISDNALPLGSKLRGPREYTIVESLHQGGFGITYRATARIMVGNIPQDVTFAIKEFFMGRICSRYINGNVVVEKENRQMFRMAKQDFMDEADMLHRLKHDGIVPVNEVFEQNDTVYYVMRYLGAMSLYDYVAMRGGRLSEAEAKAIVMQLANAVAYLHDNNILHLDIKPDNIMMVQMEDGSMRPVFIDFGQAMHFTNGKPTRSKGVGGYSKGYSPLELKDDITTFCPHLDVYSIAATLFYMLSGTDPCDASELSAHKIYKALPKNISQPTIDAIIGGMWREANSRPSNIASFMALLSGVKVDNRGNRSKYGYTTRPIDRHATQPINHHATTPIGHVRSSETWSLKKMKSVVVWYTLAFGFRLNGVLTPLEAIISKFKKKSNGAKEGNGRREPLYVEGTKSENESKVNPSFDCNNSSFIKKTLSVNTVIIPIRTGVSIEMVHVEAGTFMMGATPEMQDCFDGEKPAHRVVLTNDYYISKYKVTYEIWDAVMGRNPSNFHLSGSPVRNVSFKNCLNFIRQLNHFTGRKFRLPTEAEWEFAARGGKKSHGYQYSGSNDIDDVVGLGTKQANELGIHDMSGDMYEWCQDWFGAYSNLPQTNPTGPVSGEYRVCRGGCWGSNAGACRLLHRSIGKPDSRYDDVGLRLCLSE